MGVAVGSWRALRDFERQTRAGQDQVFRSSGIKDLPGDLPDSVWTAEYAASPDRTG